MVKLFHSDVDEANRVIDTLAGRNAELEKVAQAMGQHCELRHQGRCDLECLGRILCNVKGLRPIQNQELTGCALRAFLGSS